VPTVQFNEPTFLLLFLPVLLAVYYALPFARAYVLLAGSVVFCFWGGKQTVFTLAVTLAFNYALGLVVARRRAVLVAGIVANLALLIWCKYAAFLGLPLPKLASPPGLSFLTFVAIAYLVDVYRGAAEPIGCPVKAGNYFLFFSRLWAGPIVRRKDGELLPLSRELFAEGVRRFILGLGKKVLIANTVAGVADKVFALPVTSLRPELAWLGVVSYTVQIYFDFAGYTDMAIGLGLMFGYRFPENFNYPYAATSIRDFWRRWHMTLSGWLRDYLYIPLGGSRCAPWRAYLNLLVVFTLCGLWHGAAWTFVVWGLIQGCFLLVERATGNKDLPPVAGHVYALLVTMVSWVFFRAESLGQATGILSAMVGLNHVTGVADGVAALVDPFALTMLVAGMFGAFPVFGGPRFRVAAGEEPTAWARRSAPLREAGYIAVLLGVLVMVAVKTYTPFIYQQF
jgi:alginate O-acetyltransferase complex protein AlgI